MPSGIQDLLIIKGTPKGVAIIQLALWAESTDYKVMEFHAKQLEKRLETIQGVRKAEIWGYPQQIVAVDLNLALLKHYGISVIDVNRILQGRAVNITPGFVNANTRRFNVKASGNIRYMEELENTVVLSNDSLVLRLKDVASIGFSSREPSYLALFNKRPVIFLTVQQRGNTNIFDLTEKLNDEIAKFKQSLPSNVKVDTIFQQSDTVKIRVNGFFENLW